MTDDQLDQIRSEYETWCDDRSSSADTILCQRVGQIMGLEPKSDPPGTRYSVRCGGPSACAEWGVFSNRAEAEQLAATNPKAYVVKRAPGYRDMYADD